ncbi:MAG: zinc-ribbon domain-containing protein [Planctomycetota bacterium]|jgi:tellurium resistance protein TerD
MTLFPCPECRKPISDKADTCPHCGTPIDAERLRRAAQAKRNVDRSVIRKHRRQQGVLWLVALASSVVIAGGLLLRHELPAAGVAAFIAILALMVSLVWIASIEETIRRRRALVVPPGSCPRCRSTSVSAIKEGYSAGSGCCGALLLGPLGLLCGLIGADTINVHCLECGHKWRAKR